MYLNNRREQSERQHDKINIIKIRSVIRRPFKVDRSPPPDQEFNQSLSDDVEALRAPIWLFVSVSNLVIFCHDLKYRHNTPLQ